MQQAKKGDTVKIHYHGKLTDGTTFDSSKGREPLEFELGSGMVIPGFDNGVTGMSVGETKTINIPAAEAQAEANPEMSIELFFDAIDQSPTPWIFMIAERWGGSEMVRRAIAREIDFLNIDLAEDLRKFEIVQNFDHGDDLKVLANILINLCFTWAMSWISLGRQYSGMELELQKLVLKKQSITQIKLIFKGISNW